MATLQESIDEADTRPDEDLQQDQHSIVDDALEDASCLSVHVKLVMTVAVRTIYLFCLNNLCAEAVCMHIAFLAGTCLDKSIGDSKLLQVSLFTVDVTF